MTFGMGEEASLETSYLSLLFESENNENEEKEPILSWFSLRNLIFSISGNNWEEKGEDYENKSPLPKNGFKKLFWLYLTDFWNKENITQFFFLDPVCHLFYA